MFATRNLSKAVAAGNFVDRGDVAYGPSSIDSSTHDIKQIVLWMDIFAHRTIRLVRNGPLALRDKIKVDRWRFNV
jgi:hypothetical protein